MPNDLTLIFVIKKKLKKMKKKIKNAKIYPLNVTRYLHNIHSLHKKLQLTTNKPHIQFLNLLSV